MQNLFALIPPRTYGVLTALLGLLILAMVFISQYGFGLHPCTLCIWQRYPYGVMIVTGLALALFLRQRRAVIAGLSFITFLWLINSVLGAYHFGVEQHWWTFPGGCTAALYDGATDMNDLMAKIKNAPVVRCDEAVPFLFGMSMAFYNALFSFGMLIGSFIYGAVYRFRSRV